MPDKHISDHLQAFEREGTAISRAAGWLLSCCIISG